MPKPTYCEIHVQPADLLLTALPGTQLRELLVQVGFEFPCGGQGICGGCRIRVLNGNLAPSHLDSTRFSKEELQQGWRLACQAVVKESIAIFVPQWQMSVLNDQSPLPFSAQPGYAIAVDLGTTTVVCQLVDLQKGCVVATVSELNNQASFGSDIMTRLQYSLVPAQAKQLTLIIRRQLGNMISQLLARLDPEGWRKIKRVFLAGNTAMHHLFCGLPVEQLAFAPFRPAYKGFRQFTPKELHWPLPDECEIVFLPCIDGFVGSDVLAGIIATGLPQAKEQGALIDLGTNGEIVISVNGRVLCSSTAAGPAFEGGRISIGMRATAGAIYAAEADNGHLRVRFIGGERPIGICGSGLVDVVAASLQLGWLDYAGRITHPLKRIPLADALYLTQADIRQLQLAKAAISAGLKILCSRAKVTCIDKLYLGGAFGNYINPISAAKIGLIPNLVRSVVPAGNTSLKGTKLLLFSGASLEQLDAYLNHIEHVSLAEIKEFSDTFIMCLSFVPS